MSARVGIIGYPLGHSISPAFQGAAFRHLGLDIVYERWETPLGDLSRRFGMLREPGVLGANVTVPYKEKALRLVDTVDPLAMRIGAVNTVVHREGTLMGYNTDAEGFLRSLREEAAFDPVGKIVLVLGAGGAARAVAFALAEAGATSIALLNRTRERAERLAAEIAAATGASVQAVGKADYLSVLDLLVNGTTVGMRGGRAEGQVPAGAEEVISPRTLVCDLVYNPPETPLLRLARGRGARVLGGLGMLVYQGAAAFQLWTGREPPIEVMREAARQALVPAAM